MITCILIEAEASLLTDVEQDLHRVSKLLTGEVALTSLVLDSESYFRSGDQFRGQRVFRLVEEEQDGKDVLAELLKLNGSSNFTI